MAVGIGYVSSTTQSNYLSESSSKTNSFAQLPIFGLVLEVQASFPLLSGMGVLELVFLDK